MENLTEKQAQNHLRKIAKGFGLKLKFETLDFGIHCTVSDNQSALSEQVAFMLIQVKLKILSVVCKNF